MRRTRQFAERRSPTSRARTTLQLRAECTSTWDNAPRPKAEGCAARKEKKATAAVEARRCSVIRGVTERA